MVRFKDVDDIIPYISLRVSYNKACIVRQKLLIIPYISLRVSYNDEKSFSSQILLYHI